jgi:hypothetical protein
LSSAKGKVFDPAGGGASGGVATTWAQAVEALEVPRRVIGSILSDSGQCVFGNQITIQDIGFAQRIELACACSHGITHDWVSSRSIANRPFCVTV